MLPVSFRQAEHANDCGSNRGVRPGYFVPLVRIVRSAYHAACVLFRLCGREYVRPSTSVSETTAVGQGKPFVSGRLVDEVLSVKVEEIVDETHPDLDLEVDPKLAWALRHPEQFPVDVNRAEYERILRVPGIGVKSARLIVCSRRFGRLTSFDLKKMGCVMKRAQYFITCGELEAKGVNELYPERVRSLLVQSKSRKKQNDGQLTLLFKEEPA